MTEYKIQSLEDLEAEMRAVAQGKKRAPADAARASFQSVAALMSEEATWNAGGMSEGEAKGFVIDKQKLPADFPTHKHAREFWEALGRAVATFGFLEDTLARAIFSFTGTRRIPPDEEEAAFEKWLLTLEKALTDPLGGLINSYAKAVRANSCARTTNFDELVNALREAAVMRNVLCHGSWRAPDKDGRSLPFFVNKKKGVFQTPMDVADLKQTQKAVAELICEVMSSVTVMGWQFPGSNGPGLPIWPRQHEEPQEG